MPLKNLPSVKDIEDLKGKRVLIRASLNVPIEGGRVVNSFRIKRALPTINFLRKAGAKVIIIAHIGRDPMDSLEPVFHELKKSIDVKWCPETTGPVTELAVSELKEGEVLMLENVRSDKREKDNVSAFASELATFADIYVNDAFAASHRAHSSLVGIPEHLPSYFGFNFIHEYEELSTAIHPESPSLFILGGAKFETKLPLVDEYASKYTHVFIGGAHANDFFKTKGYEIGESLVSNADLEESGILSHYNLLLPVDVVVKNAEGKRVTSPDKVTAEENILDAGPETVEFLREFIEKAATILWNGPLGDYEHGFSEATEELAKLVAKAKGKSIVGGGDTVASIEGLGLEEQFGFISTAGGAMLDFLEHGTLPAIDAVLNN
mgnify:CR=1 FL=1